MIWGGVSRLAKYWHQMAAANTSMLASASGLPCSEVRIGAISAPEASSTSAMVQSVARRASSSDFQSLWALEAASKAASSCSRLHSGAWAKTWPVAGLITPNDLGGRDGVPSDGHDEVGHVLPPMLDAGLPVGRR